MTLKRRMNLSFEIFLIIMAKDNFINFFIAPIIVTPKHHRHLLFEIFLIIMAKLNFINFLVILIIMIMTLKRRMNL